MKAKTSIESPLNLKQWLLLVLMGLFVFSSPTSASETSAAPLTWQDCVRSAAARNPDLLSAILAQEASRAQYYGSYNGIFPHLSISNSYTDSSTGATDEVPASESKTWNLSGTASLDLIDFNQWASIQLAAADLRQSVANRLVSSANVLSNLYRAFGTLLYTQEEIGVNKSIRDLWNNNAQMINLRYDSGAESKGDDMQTQAQFLQADVALDQAGRDKRVAQQQLAQALGQDEFSALTVTGTWATEAAPATPPDFEKMVDHLPPVLAQQAVVEETQAALRAAHSALWPTLSLNYNKGVEGNTELPQNPYWVFSGVVNYPLFGNGLTSTYFASSSASRLRDKALQDLRSIRNQSLSTLESAWSGFAAAQDQVRVQKAFLDSAIQRKNEADIMYQSGLMTFQDWQLITTDFVNFQKSFLSAEENLIFAVGQWRFAIGQQLGDQP